MTGAAPPKYVTKVEEATQGRGEDRLAVVRLPDRTVFVIADGAGGVVAGAAAAETVCGAVVAVCNRGTPPSWAEWLSQVDRSMPRAGLAAAVVVEVGDDGRVVGASVGDCEAWLLSDAGASELTSGQFRKPLLGEGKALPVAFEQRVAAGVLLVATDGLWKYASRKRVIAAADDLWKDIRRERIVDAAPGRSIEAAASALVDGARLKSGALQDDVAVAICDVSPSSAGGAGT